MFCKNCGAQMQDGEMFCPECGARQDQQPAPQQYAPADAYGANPYAQQPVDPYGANAYAQQPAQPEKASKLGFLKKLPKWAPIVAIVLVAAILVGIFVIPNLGGSSSKGTYKKENLKYVLYSKDGDLYLVYPGDKTTKKLTGDFAGSSSVRYYEPTSRLFFGKDGDDGYTLYWVKTGSSKADKLEPHKVASGVDSYYVLDGGKTLYFMKDNSLYSWNFSKESSNKIKSEIDEVYIDADSGARYFTVEEKSTEKDDDGSEREKETYTVYSFNKKDESTKVADGLVTSPRFSHDYAAFAYFKDDAIHTVVNGKEKAKIEIEMDEKDDNYTILYVNSDGSLAYALARGKDKGVTVDTYVDNAPDYMQDSSIYALSTNVYLVDKNGKETKKIEHVNDYDREYNDKLGYVLYLSIIELGSDEKLDYDNYDTGKYDGINDFILKSLGAKVSYSVLIDGTLSEVLSADYADRAEAAPENISLSKDGSIAAYLTDVDDDSDTGTLMKVKISGKKVGKPEKVASDVYSFYLLDTGDILNRRDYDSEEGTCTLYLNNNKIADDVRGGLDYAGGKALTFGTDYSKSSSTFTLNYYNGSKAVKVKDDVRTVLMLSKKAIFFVDNWDKDDYEGELQYYNGSKIVKLASDVSSVFIPYNAE